MVSSQIINERLREISENIGLLEELKAMSFKEFHSDPKIVKCAERCLEVSIQSILDICHHIIVDSNWPRPKDNKEAILTLGRKKVIPSNFANRILPMAGLRNILAHEYLKIDTKQIYQHLQNLKDFRTFQKHIVKFLKNA
jgi:uncharacterized protein YutE (UPF0331/DUF86 family)